MTDKPEKGSDHTPENEGITAVLDRCVNALSPKRSDEAPSPVPTGFPELDEHIGGLHPGELTVLAARPEVGKTSLALQIALNAARSGSSVAFFSLAWSAKRLSVTLLSQTSRIPLEALRQCALGKIEMTSEIGRLNLAVDELEGLDMRIYDTPGVSLPEIEALMKVHAWRPGGTLCVVDYLQLVKPPIELKADSAASFSEPAGNDERAREIERIVYGLETMAMSLRIPVLALSPLPRVVGHANRKRPLVRDFRNLSVALGADTLLLLDRSLSSEEAATERRPGEGEAVVIIAKNAHGTCRDHKLVFDKERLSFSEPSSTAQSV